MELGSRGKEWVDAVQARYPDVAKYFEELVEQFSCNLQKEKEISRFCQGFEKDDEYFRIATIFSNYVNRGKITVGIRRATKG